MKQKKSFDFRAIQFDLAGIPQTIKFLKEKIDFIAQYDYNYLFLYIEGRIRTKSFSALPDNYSYSPEEITELVEYAKERNIETIPIVSFFAHASVFLDKSGFENMAELRNNTQGRLNKVKNTFCPSSPEALEFITNYATEVAELFPSSYFHAGFDEIWDIGYCDKCRERLKTEGQSGIFSQHLKFVYDLLSSKLGKNVMIWDDMFNFYPMALEIMPKDIILCSWHYEIQIDYPQSHGDYNRNDLFKEYDSMGIRYLATPAAASLRNIKTLTEYAAKSQCLGMFLSQWECIHNASPVPAIVYAGMLWSSRFQESFSPKEAIMRTTPLKTPAELALANWYLTLDAYFAKLQNNHHFYLRGPLNDIEYQRNLLVHATYEVFSKHDSLKSPVLQEILIELSLEKCYFALRKIISELYTPGLESDLSEEILYLTKILKDISAQRRDIDKKERPDRPTTINNWYLEETLEMVQQLPRKGPLCEAVLKLRYIRDSAPFTISVKFKGSRQWHEVKSFFSYQLPITGYFQAVIPLELKGIPEALRFEYSQYAQGNLMFCSIETAAKRYIPSALTHIEGKVIQPEALLKDGFEAAYFGDIQQVASSKYRNPENKGLHSVELLIAPEEYDSRQ